MRFSADVDLTDFQVQLLGKGGVLIFNDVVRPSDIPDMVDAIRTLPLTAGRVGKHRELVPAVRGDATCFVDVAEAPQALLPAVSWFQALQHSVNERAWLGLRSFELMAARYDVGSRYASHVDTFHGDRRRRLTAVLYLQPDWQPTDGGVLRAHLDDGPIDVAPVGGRAVVFLADRVQHEVLVAHRQRWALTAWFSAHS